MCAHLGPFDDGTLACIRTDAHFSGHIYESTSAGDDRHADGGHG